MIQKYGGFTLTMQSAMQADAVLPLVQAELRTLREWRAALTVEGGVISVPTETQVYAEEYATRMEHLCRTIAEQHPDFSFTMEAMAEDDGGTYAFHEVGSFGSGVFEYTVDASDCDDEGVAVLHSHTFGELVDGVMRFDTEREVQEYGDEDAPDEEEASDEEGEDDDEEYFEDD